MPIFPTTEVEQDAPNTFENGALRSCLFGETRVRLGRNILHFLHYAPQWG